tara:strand:- start:183 stop:548 length:366 start_codon:yes stop_codon:yes gene_type:complete
MYEYKFKLSRVVDGDTVDGSIDLGFGIFVKKRIRLLGINAPETRLQRSIKNVEERDKEKQLGLMAKAKLKELLRGKEVLIQTQLDKTGKFGRVLGTLITLDNDSKLNINSYLVSHGYAKKY